MPVAQELTINTSASALDLANAIFGSGITVTGATFQGAIGVQSGIYSGATTTLAGITNIDGGVILSTGNVQDFTNSSGTTNTNVNANTSTNVTGGIDGDAQLNAIAGVNTFDGAILNATFIPDGDMLTMNFVFSSEEYPEYVNGGVNDAFGVWVNGQFVPVSITVAGNVSIDTVNAGVNENLYRTNGADQFNTEMDGFTYVLSIKAPVNPGVANDIRIGIADGGDAVYDSNLLIMGESIQTYTLAMDDDINILTNSTRTFDILANDDHPNGTQPQITQINGQNVVAGQTITLASGQQVRLNADGTITVFSNGAVGDENFSYTIIDSQGNQDVGFITLHTLTTPTRDGIVSGTSGNDLINGSYVGDPDGDRIDNNDGLGVQGTTGNADLIYAGSGNDTILSGASQDIIYGGTGIDSIDGGAGADTIYADEGNDIVFGGIGNDVVDLGSGDDSFGSSTTDAGDDTIFGGSGNDSVISGAGNDSVSGGDGDDTLYGSSGNDTLIGDAGNDRLFGGSGNDTSFGGAGNDTLQVTDTDEGEVLFGGADNDQLLFATTTTTSGVNVTFTGNGAGTFNYLTATASGSFAEIERFGLTDYGDVLDGTASQSALIVGGGSGNDVLTGGSAADTLSGDTGNDTLNGGAGADSVAGGSGDDVLRLSNGHGQDSLQGGETGETSGDTLNASAMTDNAVLDLSAGNAANPEDGTLTSAGGTVTFAEIEAFVLGAGRDQVIGSAGNDVVSTGSGADTVDGGAGNDRFDLGAADGASDLVVIADGDGADQVSGFEAPLLNSDGSFTGRDLLDVRGLHDANGAIVNTDDVVVSDDGNGNAVLTFPGGESLTLTGISPAVANNPAWLAAVGIPRPDYIVEGTADNDTIDGSYLGDPEGDMVDAADSQSDGNDDVIDAGAGDDLVYAGAGGDTVQGGSGRDTVFGGDGADSLSGGDDDDSLNGGSGNDTLFGNAGSDTVYGEDGDDVINTRTDPGLGVPDEGVVHPTNPALSYPADTDPTNDRDLVDAGAGNDTVLTGDDDDTIYGGSGDDRVDAGFDDDSVEGGLGHDTLEGNEGADTIHGGDGNDVISGGLDASNPDYSASLPYDLTDDLDPNPNNNRDLLFGGAGDDTIRGQDDADSLYGGIGNDVLDGGIDDDLLAGGEGDDLLLGGHGLDTLDGGEGHDTLQGGQGDDLLFGGSTGDDLLEGGEGNDTLNALSGADTLDGGAGNDVLNASASTGAVTVLGGSGDDTVLGSAGADSLLGGEDRDLFQNLGTGDAVDGGDGGDDNDTLDLSDWGKDRTNILFDPNDRENGTVQFLDAAGTVIGSMTFSDIETVVPCFTPGSLIATSAGEVLVQDLRVGDMVLTRDNGYQPVRWVGVREVTGRELSAAPNFWPVQIAQGALGEGLPMRSMRVSPQHRMLFTSARSEMYFGEREVLVAAVHLVGQPGIERVCPLDGVQYIHLLFDQHEVIRADGAWTESFQPGDLTLAGMDDAQRNELLALFPELQEGECFPAARRSLRAHESRVLLMA